MRRGDALVAAAAVGFGVTVPLSKVAVDAGVGTWSVVALRFLAGGLALLPVALRRAAPPWREELRLTAPAAGALLAGYALLTAALGRTTSTAAAFLSYLLVVIVPVLSAALLRRAPSRPVTVGIVVSTAGLLLLTGGIRGFGTGEALALGCAVAFSVHVLLMGAYAERVDALRFSALQLLVVGVAAVPVGWAAGEGAVGAEAGTAALVACVAGGLAGAGALVAQLVGQRVVSPSRTSLLLMIDPVVAAAGGFVLGERVGWRGAAGCVLILAGVAAAELLTARSRSGEDNERYG